ncbi:hypothetical protein RvY_00054 [Ramazzottius varieornatus]|uniref:Uncharacterized protein n=1 Tax=Ramazzottius varieornatus TaxID=947166 RepID=A0A1D1UHQ0_RAMVA|nr:hypothetical protein RvY_00054 [Ramazzottius varieornatus]
MTEPLTGTLQGRQATGIDSPRQSDNPGKTRCSPTPKVNMTCIASLQTAKQRSEPAAHVRVRCKGIFCTQSCAVSVEQ